MKYMVYRLETPHRITRTTTESQDSMLGQLCFHAALSGLSNVIKLTSGMLQSDI